MTEKNKEELFKRMKKLREQNPQFDNLVSEIDAEFKRCIDSFKKTATYLEYNPNENFYGEDFIFFVPYVKLTITEHEYLTTYLKEKYSQFGDSFSVTKRFFKNQFKIENCWFSYCV